MAKFKKHKFISKEKLLKLFKLSLADDMNIGYKDDIIDCTRFVRIGYGQYTLVGTEEREIYIRTIKSTNCGKNIVSNHYLDGLRIRELCKIDGFEYLSKYNKIKPIYKMSSPYTKEIMDCEGYAMPSGRLMVELVGLLVK